MHCEHKNIIVSIMLFSHFLLGKITLTLVFVLDMVLTSTPNVATMTIFY